MVVNSLIKNRNFEITKEAYNYLFENISTNDTKKCEMLQNIFLAKYNYDNISDAVNQYCRANIQMFNQINYLNQIYSSVL
jgi:Cys-tRNA synthase (O-phospho-L-seryl-tRNA:Cys-tRNA synthase)